MNAVTINTIPAGFDPAAYDKILVGFSGGKDSLACVLRLIELGVSRHKIELHHHDVDADGPAFMDWTVTRAYCKAVALALGVPLFFSYREGGFLREMLKQNDRSAPIAFDRGDGSIGHAGGTKGKIDSRMKFPQQAADLSVRWCSYELKIAVMDALIRNTPGLQGLRLLVVTGERAQESTNRAKYIPLKPHRTDSKARPVDHWLPVHQWSEDQVWEIIRRFGIVPHPAYQLGWGRLSCMTCIFGSPNQWATIRAVFPDFFERIRDRERQFGITIRRGFTVEDQADRGTPYPAALANPALVRLARSDHWEGPILVSPDAWTMPAGAFGESVGPS